MAYVTSEMTELARRNQDSEDFDLESDDLFTDVYLNTVHLWWASTYHEDIRELECANHSRKQKGAVTGPEVTIMSGICWVINNKQMLCGPNRKPLGVLGTVHLALTLNDKYCTQICIVHNLRSNLLGLLAFRQLHMIFQIDLVEKKHSS